VRAKSCPRHTVSPHCMLDLRLHSQCVLDSRTSHTQLTGTPLSLSPACRVTQLEADRLEETREDREAFRRMLLAEVERQAREKNVHIKLPDGRQL